MNREQEVVVRMGREFSNRVRTGGTNRRAAKTAVSEILRPDGVTIAYPVMRPPLLMFFCGGPPLGLTADSLVTWTQSFTFRLFTLCPPVSSSVQFNLEHCCHSGLLSNYRDADCSTAACYIWITPGQSRGSEQWEQTHPEIQAPGEGLADKLGAQGAERWNDSPKKNPGSAWQSGTRTPTKFWCLI